jgi:nitrogen fixation protein FixH
MTDTAAAAPMPGTEPTSAWRSPWVRGWIALVVVVLVVNITMVTLAFVTSPGLVVEDYYERGRAMEQSIRARAAATPEWMLSSDIPADLRVGQTTRVRFFAVDKVGQPVTPDAVTFFVYRPADAGSDFSLPMVAEAPGRYVAELSFPLPGVWDSLIAVRHGEAEYQLDQRLYVERARP